jgi:small GTP-binding protein
VRVVVDGSEVALSFWDTNGTEAFKAVTPFYLRDSEAVILVFDVTDPQTLQDLDGWVRLAVDSCRDVPLFVVANKIDLDAQVGREDARRFADAWEATVFEVSALRGDGVGELFAAVAAAVKDGIRPFELARSEEPETKCCW